MSETKNKEEVLPDYKSIDTCLNLLKTLLDKLTPKYTKFYTILVEQESLIVVKVEFKNPNYKIPNPPFSCCISFKMSKLCNPRLIEYQLENELAYIPLIEGTNLTYFQTIIDKNIITKEKNAELLKLHTNFESTRLQNTTGEKLNLYFVEQEANIFSNNNSDYFNSGFHVEFMSTKELYSIIKRLWKALSNDNDTMSYESFILIFQYGELAYSEEHIHKLWSYSALKNKDSIEFDEFVKFSIDFFQSLKAYYIASYKDENNPYLKNKISKAVEIMNKYFKQLDYENNSEIYFKDLKDCLNKENELFSKNEIEIILNQINPDNKFEYWKFENILKILYYGYFDYNKLIKEDKIYKYLINIFEAQDELKKKKLNFMKIKYALNIESKLNLNKLQIIIFLNFFDIVNKPEIDYYKGSILLRNVVEVLYNPNISIQKIDLMTEKYSKFIPYEDKYDECHKKIIEVQFLFLRYF